MRAVIYARGDPDEIGRQQEQCRIMAESSDTEVVALATDRPDCSDAWHDANAMVVDGEADKILIASRDVIPHLIESVTGHIRGRRPRRLHPPD